MSVFNVWDIAIEILSSIILWKHIKIRGRQFEPSLVSSREKLEELFYNDASLTHSTMKKGSNREKQCTCSIRVTRKQSGSNGLAVLVSMLMLAYVHNWWLHYITNRHVTQINLHTNEYPTLQLIFMTHFLIFLHFHLEGISGSQRIV